MKLLIASDIHGSLPAAEFVVSRSRDYDWVILLGDLLYHGPRNDLPSGYRPKAVIEKLNSIKDRIVAVRGNCEAEVDQMVLQFPVMSEYSWFVLGDRRLFLTHGHLWGPTHMPPLTPRDILLSGHTHIPVIDGQCMNPGSLSIPKGGFPTTYMVYDNGRFEIRTMDDKVILQKEIEA